MSDELAEVTEILRAALAKEISIEDAAAQLAERGVREVNLQSVTVKLADGNQN